MLIDFFPNKKEINQDLYEPVPFLEQEESDEGVLFEKSFDTKMINSDYYKLYSNSADQNQTFLKDAKFQESVEEEEGILKITICDTGVGIEADDIGKLFNVFN